MKTIELFHRFLIVLGFAVLVPAPPAASQPASQSTHLEPIVGMIEQNQLTAAEAALRSLLKQQPEHEAPIHDLLGVVLSRQGQFEEAEQHFSGALKQDPNLHSAHENLARLYLLKKKDSAALGHLREAARLGPLQRDLATQLAFREQQAGNSDAAEAQLISLAQRFDSVQALVQLSRIAAGRSDMETSLKHLRQALEIAPNSENLLANYARSALASGNPVAAMMTLEPLTRMFPGVAEYPYLMGVIRMQLADLPGSVESLERALELEPKNALTWIGLGLALNNQKRYAEAKEALLRSLQLDPNNLEAMASLAESEDGLDNLTTAMELARRVLSRLDTHATANLILGQSLMKQGNHTEAHLALTRAVTSNPKSAKAHYQLSLALARLGRREESQKHLEIYRQTLREDEEHLIGIRTQANFGGDQP